MHVLDRRSLGTLFALPLFPVALFDKASGQTTFRFQSGFWINLHHFVFQRAVELPTDELADSAGLGPEEAKAWRPALGYYRKEFDGKDLLQRDMAATKNALGEAGNDRSLDTTGLDEELVDALE